jgi:hypothetical protein
VHAKDSARRLTSRTYTKHSDVTVPGAPAVAGEGAAQGGRVARAAYGVLDSQAKLEGPIWILATYNVVRTYDVVRA